MNVKYIRSTQGAVGLLELDTATQLATSLGLDLSVNKNVDIVQNILLKMAKLAKQHLSGIVIDPLYSFEAIQLPGKGGCVTRLNAITAEMDPLALPVLMPDHGLEEIRNNYSLAKLELFFHPQEKNALQKKQVLAEIQDYCQYLGIDWMLKLKLFEPKGLTYDPDQFQEDLLNSVFELARFTNLIAIQYPLEPLTAATITAELDVPWLMVDEHQDYEQFKNQLRICLENGATGFAVGQVLWQDMTQLKLTDYELDWPQLEQFLETTFQDRLIELMRITNEISVANNE